MDLKKIILGTVYIAYSFVVNAQENSVLDVITKDNIQDSSVYRPQHKSIVIKEEIQIKEADLIKSMDKQSPFGVYKDTYFTTGVPLNKGINRSTADALFQISIRHRLTKSILPFNSFLYLTYTQKSFWNIYSSSSPFRDTNYNPGIGVGKYIIHNGKFIGTLFLSLEHESNGKDGDASRSWNFISISGKYFINKHFSLGHRLWIPYVDGGENKDLLNYKGLFSLSANIISFNKMWWISAEITPRKGWGNANTAISIGYKFSNSLNQYFFLRFNDGKGESLLHYNKYNMNLRIGFCIKPDFYSFF